MADTGVTVDNRTTIAWRGALPPQRPRPVVEKIGAIFLAGTGIEIGALHRPLPMPPAAKVKYVDRMCVADLRKQYPELGTLPLVEADIIDNGETLGTIADNSCDFVVASHFLEHAADPIGTVKNMLRVTRVGGVVLLSIPDKRHTFDRERPVTPFEHLLRDHREGPEWSRLAHFEEWVRYVDKVTEPAAFQAMVQRRIDMDYSIHHHVWTNNDMVEMFHRMRKEVGLPIEIAAMMADYAYVEVIFVLRKLA